MAGIDAAGPASRTPLLIFPCNGNGVEALDCIRDSHRCVAFIDDAPEKQGTECYGLRVLSRSALAEFGDAQVLAVPGGPSSFRSRREVIAGLGVAEERFPVIIHRTAAISPFAVIGHNVLLMAGVVLTGNAVIGNHVCVLPNTVIHHDVVIGAWSLIGANVTLAGGVVVGENCYVGSGTSVMNGLRIGDGALLGLGSNVIRDVETGTVVAGNPARELS